MNSFALTFNSAHSTITDLLKSRPVIYTRAFINVVYRRATSRDAVRFYLTSLVTLIDLCLDGLSHLTDWLNEFAIYISTYIPQYTQQQVDDAESALNDLADVYNQGQQVIDNIVNELFTDEFESLNEELPSVHIQSEDTPPGYHCIRHVFSGVEYFIRTDHASLNLCSIRLLKSLASRYKLSGYGKDTKTELVFRLQQRLFKEWDYVNNQVIYSVSDVPTGSADVLTSC